MQETSLKFIIHRLRRDLSKFKCLYVLCIYNLKNHIFSVKKLLILITENVKNSKLNSEHIFFIVLHLFSRKLDFQFYMQLEANKKKASHHSISSTS
jgi:hypothetical protein